MYEINRPTAGERAEKSNEMSAYVEINQRNSLVKSVNA
jgi:hypothetical protein